MRVAIIDYRLGNLRSVAGAIKRIGHEPLVTNEIDQLIKADKLVLPGVGAFGEGISNLKEFGLIEPLNRMVLQEKKPILGICLGFQLMFTESEEFGKNRGLNWIEAPVVKIDAKEHDLRVPHVGWNDMFRKKDSILWVDIPENALFYYVHSYKVQGVCQEWVIGTCHYGASMVSAIQKENIYGTQFHPEKSQLHGLQVLKNFIEKS